MANRTLLVFCLLMAGLWRPALADPVSELAGLSKVGVDVELDPSQETLSTERLARRIVAHLSEGTPGLAFDPAARDRLRLAVAVRPYGATALRGFWLPFSGTYGIGPVRLSLERVVTITGVAEPVRASVWHTERLAAGPWSKSPGEILGLLDETVTIFLQAYQRR